MNRREFIARSSSAALALYFTSCASKRIAESGEEAMEIPDLSDGNVVGATVGIRPYRNKSVRIERSVLGDKILVHNYGHGGAGFTMAWGSAEVVADLIDSEDDRDSEVAVLGAGVIGLSAAKVLQERGYKVTLYAKSFSPDTTSDLGGAQWSPSAVAKGETEEEKRLFSDVLVRSYRRYEHLQGRKYGISRKLNYVAEGFGGPLDSVPAGLIPPPEKLTRLPFPGVKQGGRLYHTFLIEPPIYLPALMRDLQAAEASFVTRTFSDSNEMRKLPQATIVNCTGLGAGELCGDPEIVPIRGQLVRLKPKELPYLLVHEGYIFPRNDAVILGGSFEKGITDTTPDPMTTAKILELSRSFFGLSTERKTIGAATCT